MWTIGELAERAAEALRPSADPGRDLTAPSPNGRVRDVPNERLIRWYTTIGLLDPPLARRGRVALYGRRHLTQLVAIKRRQAAGRSIAEIQVELAGATDAALEAIARLPSSSHSPVAASPRTLPAPPASPASPVPPAAASATVPAPTAAAPLTAPPALPRAARRDTPDRFWARDAAARRPPTPEMGTPQAAPLEPTPQEPSAKRNTTVRPPATHPDEPAGRDTATAPELVQGIRLSPSTTLLLGTTPRPLRGDDIAAIIAAARPLLDALYERGLTDDASREIR